jgi:hypothetical protein
MAIRVKARCVKAALRHKTKAGEDADSVALVAERAGRSPRTIYRVMDYADDKLMQLDLADRLLLACDTQLSIECEDDVDVLDG